MTFADLTIKIVNENTGIKGTELISLAVSEAIEEDIELPEYYIDTINLLVEQGKICEFEFVLPSTSYRIRSIYFPTNSEGRMINFTPWEAAKRD